MKYLETMQQSLFSWFLSRAAMIKKNRFLFPILILGGGVFFVLVWSNHISSSFFYDEAVYVNLAKHPFHSDYYSDPIFFRHPPGYYLLLFLVGKVFGFGEVVMRIPSLLFALASVGVVYLMGKRLRSVSVGAISAILLLLNTLHQQYSQAATMYSMAAFFVVLFAYGIVIRNRKLVLGAFLGALLTHFFAFLLTPSLILFLVPPLKTDRRLIWSAVLICAAIFLLLSPILLPGFLFHLSRVTFDYWWFQLANLFSNLSPLLIFGYGFFIYQNFRHTELRPIILIGPVFLVFSIILVPFVRYLEIFLPLLLMLGVCGLYDCVAFVREHSEERRTFLLLLGASLLALAFYMGSFGFYPYQHGYIDFGDVVYTEEWKEVAAAIASSGHGGSIMTSRVMPFRYYADMQGIQYEIAGEVRTWDEDEIRKRVAEGADDWIVVQTHLTTHSFFDLLEHSPLYEKYGQFRYTALFKKITPAGALP